MPFFAAIFATSVSLLNLLSNTAKFTLESAVITLDVMMPVMDGFDFLVELHANPDWREIPVIVLISKDLTSKDRRMLSGRVERILEKDAWSHEQLVDLVQKLSTGPEAA